CAGGPQGREGSGLAEYVPGKPGGWAQAPYAADYGLYRCEGAGRPPGPGEPPLLWRGLSEGEAVGFVNEGGGLGALAGPERIPLDEGRYCWRVTPETELRGAALARHEAGKALATAARVSCGTALGLLFLPLVVLWRIPVSPFPF